MPGGNHAAVIDGGKVEMNGPKPLLAREAGHGHAHRGPSCVIHPARNRSQAICGLNGEAFQLLWIHDIRRHRDCLAPCGNDLRCYSLNLFGSASG